MSKVPVFDIGDTLFPTARFFRESVRSETDREDFRIGNFNIFDPRDSEKYFSEKGVKIDGKKVRRNYIEKVEDYMRENRLELLKRCGNEFGPIGVISDNWSYAETFYSDMFNEHGIDFEGIVISEVVGSTKPEEEIFNKFLNQRKRGAEEFVYFGNHGMRDAAATNVGMEFVFTTEYNNFDSEHQGRKVSKLNFENVRKEVSR
jgi:FMN phosphatase YigB (HAD superfamily)